ncbi:L-rhamnose-1-dehydrogenase [Arthroderma sp. PD_2]|nr:L-rhamnose-1-dehydrogenase [Arthroderma sp. PD_2]
MSPSGLLCGKVAAITGGLTGIGRAIAVEYIRQGAYVAVNHLGLDHEQALISSLQKEVADIISSEGKNSPNEEENVAESVKSRLITVAGDVSLPETGSSFIKEAVSAFGRLDVFVNNAGICEFKEFLEISPTLFDKTVSVNLGGAFYVTQAAARQMALSQSPPGGSIIGISSISALVGGGLQAHYTPTKAGISSLMQSCAVSLGKHGIRCNALLPGTIRTGLNEEDLKDDEKRTYMEGRVPLGRLGEPKDLAGPAVFLACSELSGYVTGAQLLVDGGLFVNLQ